MNESDEKAVEAGEKKPAVPLTWQQEVEKMQRQEKLDEYRRAERRSKRRSR